MAAADLNGNLTIVEKAQLFARLSKLPMDEKIELVKALVPQPIVVLGGTHQMSGLIIFLANMAEPKIVAEVIEAISDRLKNR